jgi:hypothetical protein
MNYVVAQALYRHYNVEGYRLEEDRPKGQGIAENALPHLMITEKEFEYAVEEIRQAMDGREIRRLG